MVIAGGRLEIWRLLHQPDCPLTARVFASVILGLILGAAFLSIVTILAIFIFSAKVSPVLFGSGTIAAIVCWLCCQPWIWHRDSRRRGGVAATLSTIGIVGCAFVAGAIVDYYCTGEVEELFTVAIILLTLAMTLIVWSGPIIRLIAKNHFQQEAVTFDLLCPSCGYSLIGLSESRCPECGARWTLDELLSQMGIRVAGIGSEDGARQATTLPVSQAPGGCTSPPKP